jgi:hypothetical protein
LPSVTVVHATPSSRSEFPWPGRYSTSKVILSVAGDKDILLSTEWPPSDFEEFQGRLKTDVSLVSSAIAASTVTEANRLWKLAFGE